MTKNRSVGTLAVILLVAGSSSADFKYTQQSKATGGALVAMTKTLGVFSKNARQVTEPTTTTTMLKGNRMRTEHSTGTVEVIDLDGRRFLHVDPVKKTYSITTFDQFKQQMEQAREKMKQEQAKAAAKHGDAQSVQMVPKFDAQATGNTRTILNLPTKEMKMRMDMQFKSSDPKTEEQLEKSNASTWFTSDSWMAASVPGYSEMRQFYLKMAKELDWLPGSMGMANPQMTQAMDEFRKKAVQMDGMPLLQYTSFGMTATGQPGQAPPASGQNTQAAQPNQAAQPCADKGSNTAPANPITKGLGGIFGGFGKKKQPDTTGGSDSASGSCPATPDSGSPQGTTASNSMMDMTIEVTSYSSNSLDSSLFDVPAGYTQVQPDANAPFAGR